MRSFVFVMIIIALFVLSGCGTPQREVRKMDMMDISTRMPSVITYPADIRGAYVVRDDAKLKFCAEPVPDVALESVHKLIGKLNLTLPQQQTIGADVTSELTAKAIELAGRTQLLLIAREMLYRACEMSVNHPDLSSNAKDMYKIVVELIRDLGQAEKTQANANLVKKQAELENAKAALKKTEGGPK